MSKAIRKSPIAPALAGSHRAIDATLWHPGDLVSLGVKGPALATWAAQLGLELPANLYDVLSIGERISLIRVGGQEIILECPENEPHLTKLEEALRHPTPNVHRIEQ